MDSMNIVVWKQGADVRSFPSMVARLADVADEFYFRRGLFFILLMY
jgi:hypothetical protein